jgi:hypothetical protein
VEDEGEEDEQRPGDSGDEHEPHRPPAPDRSHRESLCLRAAACVQSDQSDPIQSEESTKVGS